jgi:gliding motility-associated-like protein
MACCILPISGIENRPKMRRACLDRIDSTLDLLWFKPTDNCASFTGFNLYGRDNILSPFQLLGAYNSFSLSTLSLKLPNLKNWEFYLVYSLACNGSDSIFSDTILVDNTPPLNSDLDSVSVDLITQKTQIGWRQNASLDVKGYLVYHITGTNSVITNTTGTSYLDLGTRNPANASVNYGVAAFDSCNNASLISSPHSTVFLQSTYDQCKQSINLKWSNYIGWPVEGYQVYLKTNAGSYQLVASLVSNINQFTYNFSSFGNTYCFFIRALKTGGVISSSSNTVCISTSGIIPSKNSYIAKASVQNKLVELTLATETGTSLQKINIYKGEDNGPFVLWQSISSSGGIVELMDANVNVASKSYKYFFTTEGPCALIFDTTQMAKTILLNVVMLTPGDQLLSWNLYDDFIKSSQKQELLLSDNPNFNKSSPWNTLATLSNSAITHQDFTNFGINQEQICYCIRAIENLPNPSYPRLDSSYSNIACVTADPIVFFPNAIQINGYNTSFLPKGVFIDYEKSSFQIYNRWGEIIYETSDIRKAWHGTFNDNYVESDVYAYHAIIVGINGSTLRFDGTITVLK